MKKLKCVLLMCTMLVLTGCASTPKPDPGVLKQQWEDKLRQRHTEMKWSYELQAEKGKLIFFDEPYKVALPDDTSVSEKALHSLFWDLYGDPENVFYNHEYGIMSPGVLYVEYVRDENGRPMTIKLSGVIQPGEARVPRWAISRTMKKHEKAIVDDESRFQNRDSSVSCMLETLCSMSIDRHKKPVYGAYLYVTIKGTGYQIRRELFGVSQRGRFLHIKREYKINEQIPFSTSEKFPDIQDIRARIALDYIPVHGRTH